MAIVTGGSQGIGLAISRTLAEAGARVVIANRDAARGERAAACLRGAGLGASAHPVDVTQRASVQALVDAVLKRFRRIDILVNNAGVHVRNETENLTDAEWEMLQPVFAPEGRPGRPGIYDRRRILDAIFYVVRGGGAWRMLPHDFPSWDNVYAHFRRWSDKGLFEKMHDLLRARWREREGRKPGATASIIDSQTVKTTEKGGPTGTMRARRSRDGSDTSS